MANWPSLLAGIILLSCCLSAADKTPSDGFPPNCKLSDFKLGEQIVGKPYDKDKANGRGVVICTSYVSGNDNSPAYTLFYRLFMEYGRLLDFVMVDTTSKYVSTETINRIMKRSGEGYPVFKGFKQCPLSDTKDSVNVLIFDGTGKMLFRGGFANPKLNEYIQTAAVSGNTSVAAAGHDLSEFEWGKSMNGPAVTPADLKGRPAVILLWVSRPDYQPEKRLQSFIDLHTMFGEDLTFVAVEMSAHRYRADELVSIVEMTKKAGVTFSVPAGILKYPRQIAYKYVPMCFVINSQGLVVFSGSPLNAEGQEAMRSVAVKGSGLNKPKPAEKKETTPGQPTPTTPEKTTSKTKFA